MKTYNAKKICTRIFTVAITRNNPNITHINREKEKTPSSAIINEKKQTIVTYTNTDEFQKHAE